MNRRAQTFFAAAVASIVVAACGSNGSSISTAERERLVPLVEQVRRAAESRDGNATRRRLRELRHAVAAAEDRGDITSERSSEILSAAARVETNLTLVPVATVATTAPSTTTTSPPEDPPGKGNGKRGEGKGKKHDDDD